MMKKLKLYALLAVASLLGACATFTAPRNLDDSIAYGYSQVAAVRSSAASLLERGAIDVQDARKVQSYADEARTALDAARRLSGAGDTAKAEGQLKAGLDILVQLEAYLKAQEAR